MQIVATGCEGCGAPLKAHEGRWCSQLVCGVRARMDAEERARRMTPEERAQRARNALLSKAKRAKDDPVAFFELVMRDEKTQAHVVVPPHQKVMLSFIMHHEKSIHIVPIGHGKTVSAAGLGLWLLLRDRAMRGAIVSATEGQAAKVLRLMRQVIEESAELLHIDPTFLPSRRGGDRWCDTQFTVDRPPFIRDPSFIALGIDSKLVKGSRWDYVIVDDLLNGENTNTEQQRLRTYDKFFEQVADRLEPNKSRLVIINTTWHPQDYVNRLSQFWPNVRMSAEGEVWVNNYGKGWDCEELDFTGARANDGSAICRLAVQVPGSTLWPARYDRVQLEKEREKYVANQGMFNRFFLSDPTDNETARCKKEFIEVAKKLARDKKVHKLLSECSDKIGVTFTALDPAITPDKRGCESAFFTFAVRAEDGLCQIVDIDSGHWDAVTLVQKVFAKAQLYKSFVAVESNGMQKSLIDLAIWAGDGLPIRALNTHGGEDGKSHPWRGVEGFFYELAKGRWLIPNDPSGRVSKPVERFISACRSYEPEKHTNDMLMACYLARQLAVKFGAMQQGPKSVGHREDGIPGRQPVSMEQRAMRR